MDRGEGETGTGESDEAELGDEEADVDLLPMLFPIDRSTGSIWMGGHSAYSSYFVNIYLKISVKDKLQECLQILLTFKSIIREDTHN